MQELLGDCLLFLPQNSHQMLCTQLWAHAKYGWGLYFSLWYESLSLHKRYAENLPEMWGLSCSPPCMNFCSKKPRSRQHGQCGSGLRVWEDMRGALWTGFDQYVLVIIESAGKRLECSPSFSCQGSQLAHSRVESECQLTYQNMGDWGLGLKENWNPR